MKKPTLPKEGVSAWENHGKRYHYDTYFMDAKLDKAIREITDARNFELDGKNPATARGLYLAREICQRIKDEKNL